jgi:lipid-binding SYLF domain-containing protein
MRTIIAGVLSLFLIVPAASAADEQERLVNCGTVLDEILSMPDNIPTELLDKAECVIVIPSVKKIAFGFGGSYGRGAMVCRSGKDFTGPWGPPAMYRLEGGSFGLQLGGSATDFVLLVMNRKGAESILTTKVKLGADASASAGPKGRTATAATDAYMRAEILSYSRSKGLFAGVSLEGSTLRPDNSANFYVYAKQISAREIVLEGKVGVPEAGRRLVNLLQNTSPTNTSE